MNETQRMNWSPKYREKVTNGTIVFGTRMWKKEFLKNIITTILASQSKTSRG